MTFARNMGDFDDHIIKQIGFPAMDVVRCACI